MDKDQLISDIKSALVPEIQSLIRQQFLNQGPSGSPTDTPPGSAAVDNDERARSVNSEG